MEILTLGNKIKKRRRELGLTLKGLAGDRVTPAQLSYVETDKCKPSLDLLEYISERLGLDMDYLLESEKKQAEKYCEYNVKVSVIDISRENYNEALKRVNDVYEVSLKYGLCYFLGQAEKCLGLISRNKGDSCGANSHFLSALQEFSKVGDTKEIMEVYIELGQTACEKKYYKSSIEYFKQAESFGERLEDIEAFLKLKVYFHLLEVYEELGDNSASSYYAQKASDALREFGNGESYGQALMAIGESLEAQDKYDKALKFAARAEEVFNRGAYDLGFLAKVETLLGHIYTKNNLSEEALKHLRKALDIKRAIDDNTIPVTLIEIAYSHIIKKDYDKAFKAVNEALNISIKIGNRQYEALSYYQLYRAFNQKGDYIKAEESIRRCADILESIGEKKRLADCYIEMGEFYKAINREKEAIDCVSGAIEIYGNQCKGLTL